MENDKPLISILMAVYEPRMDWLREQLLSLNTQSYPNIKLFIREDCSPTVPYATIKACVEDCIRAFPYVIFRNEKNLGSNGTFELLTTEADGDFFAYCDQDDVWLPEKLTKLYSSMTNSGAALVCSDVYIIDGESKQVADSITEVRRHHVFHSGNSIAPQLLVSNFVLGCTTLVSAEYAKKAIPFCPYMVHDHYLALYCAQHGRIQSLSQPLIQYRIHYANQTGLMAGVVDKESYYRVRICSILDRFQWLLSNFACDKEMREEIESRLIWAKAREKNWRHCGGKAEIWKYRSFSFMPSMFEIFANWLPESVFKLIIAAAKENKV